MVVNRELPIILQYINNSDDSISAEHDVWISVVYTAKGRIKCLLELFVK